MINFKITGLDNAFISIEKPAGKSISLKLGEIVKAEVMDILPSGSITLKIKGDFITAKTEVLLEKGTNAFFKVTDLPAEGKDLRLQFLGYTHESATGDEITRPSFNLKDSQIPRLIQELTNSLSDIKNFTMSGKETDSLISKLQGINSDILKALPSDINALPKEVRIELQNLLQASLKITGQSMQKRLSDFLSQLPEEIKNYPVIENLKKDIMVSIEKLLQNPLRDVLKDTGVVLEAKLKAAIETIERQVQLGGMDKEEGHDGIKIISEGKDALAERLKQTFQHDILAIKKDLKAELLQLKQLFTDEGKGVVKTLSGDNLTNMQREGIVRTIDGLIKDIETFQVLSKATDSFYTFLPINWQELRDGEVSFRRSRSDAKGTAYSCRVNLDLERFGSLSVIVMLYNKEFLVSFRVENPEFQRLLKINIKELQDSFIARGLNLKAVNILDMNDALWEQIENLESNGAQISIKI